MAPPNERRVIGQPHSGTRFFNYKRSFSVVLMALVDYQYCFITVDVGAYGSSSDGGVFARSELGRTLVDNALNLPADKILQGAAELGPLPYVIVGDEAFPIKRNLMRPYPGRDLTDENRIFNCGLSRVRRIVENAFGLLAARFRLYHRKIPLDPENVDKVVLATCALHNFIQKTSTACPTIEQFRGIGSLQEGNRKTSTRSRPICDLQMCGNQGAQEAVHIRTAFQTYFNSEAGAVLWPRQTCFGQLNQC